MQHVIAHHKRKRVLPFGGKNQEMHAARTAKYIQVYWQYWYGMNIMRKRGTLGAVKIPG